MIIQTVGTPPRRGIVSLTHRYIGIVSVVFLLASTLLAEGLTHPDMLHALSRLLYDSAPIPAVSLDEPVHPASWDQALQLARLAHGSDGTVLSMRDATIVEIGGFVHEHDPAHQARNPRTTYLIDTRTMSMVRVENAGNSLFIQAHGIHAYRFLGIEWLSLSMISVAALLALLLTGMLLAHRDRKTGRRYTSMARLHVRLGQASGLILTVVALTTLTFEFPLLPQSTAISHPIPPVQRQSPIVPGSIDQARHLATQVIGVPPRAVYIRSADHLKFSETGDGIGGKSVIVDATDMSIRHIADWRNNPATLTFILHDGRWLGDMNAFNINDAALVVLLFLMASGLILAWRSPRR